MCHVLIIEDDIASFDIRDTVRGAGATTFAFATTEREAVRAARDVKPAVIISDIMLDQVSDMWRSKLSNGSLATCR